jgi:electron transfer flavoprotein beta subunit
MKILVCLKQVPDANARLVPAASGKWIEEDSLSFVDNEFDQFALEAALQLKDQDPSTEVVLALVGPERGKTTLRNGLAKGADRALHLVDEAFAGGDPWSHSAALAALARKEGPFDLIFTGLQASDDNFGQTGPLVAERLGLPCATGAMAWSLAATELTVERELDGDRREVVVLPLPAVVTFQTGAGDKPPRYAKIPGIMAAKKKELKTPTADELGVAREEVGAAGRRMQVIRVAEPRKQAGAEMVAGTPQDVARELVRRIREKTGLL